MSQKRDFYNVFGTFCDALFKNISFCNELGIILEQGRPKTCIFSKSLFFTMNYEPLFKNLSFYNELCALLQSGSGDFTCHCSLISPLHFTLLFNLSPSF